MLFCSDGKHIEIQASSALKDACFRIPGARCPVDLYTLVNCLLTVKFQAVRSTANSSGRESAKHWGLCRISGQPGVYQTVSPTARSGGTVNMIEFGLKICSLRIRDGEYICSEKDKTRNFLIFTHHKPHSSSVCEDCGVERYGSCDLLPYHFSFIGYGVLSSCNRSTR